MFRALVLLLLFALTCGLSSLPAAAQTPAPPPGISKEQFDSLVDAISAAVVQKLKTEHSQAVAPPLARPATENDDPMAAQMGDFIGRAQRVVSAFPALLASLQRIPSALGSSQQRGLTLYFTQLVLAVILAVAAEGMTRRIFGQPRAALTAGSAVSRGPRSLLCLAGLAALDGVGLLAVWLVSYGAVGAWFHPSDPQGKLAAAVLTSIFAWRLYLFAFRIALRPDETGARLVAMDDEAAARTLRLLSLVVLAVIALRTVLRVLIAIQTPQDAVAAGQLLTNAAILWAFIAVAVKLRVPVAQWLSGLGRPGGLACRVGQNWLVIALPFFCLLVAAQIFGAISARFTIPAAMLLTLNTVCALILFETLLQGVLARVKREDDIATVAAGQPPAKAPTRPADVVARGLRVLVLIGAALAIAQTWAVNVLDLVDASQWRELTRASVRAGATLFIAYVAWEIVRLVSERYVAQHPVGGVIDEDAHPEAGATRLATLMPLMRIALAIVIVVLAVLIVLSEMGVNVTPLIAGASVFGLAISFGSQTLVKDIVSGIFYLTDDAFRIGEYIDCGKAKGTVEGFTLRSLKLRHQNGQVHTIPFGQLGQITNFSRDWSTVKFNLRFARDTDVEKLRKATKKIGVEMLEDPEIKPEVLEPLKMQGVVDIADQALVVRFKFTVRPGKPTFIQRNAIKRMVTAFPDLGIQFASATVSVQTAGAGADAGAAAAATLARIQAEAAAQTATA